MQKLTFHLGRNISTCPTPLDLRSFTDIKGPWILVRFISYPLTKNVLQQGYSTCYLLLTRPNQYAIIHVMDWGVISFGRENRSRSLQTKLWHQESEELMYPWDSTAYCWIYQLKKKTKNKKLLLADIMDRDGEKDICQINLYLLGIRECVNFFKQ